MFAPRNHSREALISAMRAVNHRAEGERQIEREEYEGAVKNFRAALELADRANVEGRGSIDYARTLFLMGRALLKLRKYAEAETALREAMDSFMPDADIAHVRDCLGRALESQGKLGPARDTRQSDPLVCSYESVRAQSLVDADGALCPRSNELFAFSALQACGRCKCIYYHDRECQKADRPRHKEFCVEQPAPKAIAARK